MLVSAPLLMLSLGVVTFALNGYAANIGQDVAIDAAHFAALADVDLSVAQQRAEENLTTALGDVFKSSVIVLKQHTEDGCRAESKVTISAVILGLLGRVVDIEEDASAVCELQE